MPTQLLTNILSFPPILGLDAGCLTLIGTAPRVNYKLTLSHDLSCKLDLGSTFTTCRLPCVDSRVNQYFCRELN